MPVGGTSIPRALRGRPSRGQASQIRLQRRKQADSGQSQFAPQQVHVMVSALHATGQDLIAQLLWTQHNSALTSLVPSCEAFWRRAEIKEFKFCCAEAARMGFLKSAECTVLCGAVSISSRNQQNCKHRNCMYELVPSALGESETESGVWALFSLSWRDCPWP